MKDHQLIVAQQHPMVTYVLANIDSGYLIQPWLVSTGLKNKLQWTIISNLLKMPTLTSML